MYRKYNRSTTFKKRKANDSDDDECSSSSSATDNHSIYPQPFLFSDSYDTDSVGSQSEEFDESSNEMVMEVSFCLQNVKNYSKEVIFISALILHVILSATPYNSIDGIIKLYQVRKKYIIYLFLFVFSQQHRFAIVLSN